MKNVDRSRLDDLDLHRFQKKVHNSEKVLYRVCYGMLISK